MDTTIIIPTLDEEQNIGKLITLIKQNCPNIKIIVSDDGSDDGTKEIVWETEAIFLDRKCYEIHGLTASVIDAVKQVNTENIIVMDGDLQHPPEKINEIIEALKTNDIVIAKRTGKMPFHIYRMLMSKTATILARIKLYGLKCKDPMSGFFGVKTKIIQSIPDNKFEMKGYKVLFDMLKQLPKTTNIKEIPYIFGERKEGSTKINKRHIFIFLRSLFR